MRCVGGIQENFTQNVYPDRHRFMADNDPKHNSVAACQYLVDCGVYWWHTPAESPDLNPIENLWHELKEFIRREVKPISQQKLADGIKEFWSTVDVAKCRKYISHLRKVIPKVIELKGAATCYGIRQSLNRLFSKPLLFKKFLICVYYTMHTIEFFSCICCHRASTLKKK